MEMVALDREDEEIVGKRKGSVQHLAWHKGGERRAQSPAATTGVPGNDSTVNIFNLEQPCLYNRALEIAWHIPWYGFKTQARLAQDSKVSPTAISRLIHGRVQPSLPVALRVTAALAQRLGRPLDLGEVFSLDGSFPTPSVCELTGCRRCLPPDAYDGEENLKSYYQGTSPGQWSQLTVNRKGGR